VVSIDHRFASIVFGGFERCAWSANPWSIPGMGSCTVREEMLTGLAATTETIDVAGVATGVWEVGAGPPLLLHGGIECGGAMWAPAARRLADGYRVVVPDLPGLGESEPVDRLDRSFDRWLVDLMAVTGLGRPTLVAHSLVGGLAARFATRRSEALAHLVLYGVPAVGRYRMPVRLRYAGLRFSIRPTVANAERLDRFALLDLDATRRLDPAWFAAFDAYTRRQAGLAHVKKTMNRLLAAGTKQVPGADLDHITTPTTLLWGRHDRMVPLSVGDEAAARHGWPLHVIDGAAHAPHIEQPDTFAATLASIGTRPR
jgi:pimeloyl-ACP methyl ester carboxylesterase